MDLFFFFLVFIEVVTIFFLFYDFVFWPHGMWGLSFPTRDRTATPALEAEVLTTELPGKFPQIPLEVDSSAIVSI